MLLEAHRSSKATRGPFVFTGRRTSHADDYLKCGVHAGHVFGDVLSLWAGQYSSYPLT
jgi:hypothetical protein